MWMSLQARIARLEREWNSSDVLELQVAGMRFSLRGKEVGLDEVRRLVKGCRVLVVAGWTDAVDALERFCRELVLENPGLVVDLHSVKGYVNISPDDWDE